MVKPPIIVVLGRYGSGKTTLATHLAKILRAEYIGTGDILRKAAKEDPSINYYVSRGMLVPSKKLFELLEEKIVNLILAGKGMVCDGVPRTEKQAEWLNELLKKLGTRVRGIIFLLLPKEKAKLILKGRLVCSQENDPKCTETYLSVSIKKPKKEGYCDLCNSPLIKRNDDKNTSAIRKRELAYDENRGHLITFYQDPEKGGIRGLRMLHTNILKPNPIDAHSKDVGIRNPLEILQEILKGLGYGKKYIDKVLQPYKNFPK